MIFKEAKTLMRNIWAAMNHKEYHFRKWKFRKMTMAYNPLGLNNFHVSKKKEFCFARFHLMEPLAAQFPGLHNGALLEYPWDSSQWITVLVKPPYNEVLSVTKSSWT